MAYVKSIIETGVDKLVNLINSRGRISSFDAAKELGVSPTVVMEWADFLEEEGVINIEYKFTKPFLVARKLGKKEVQEKEKEFSGKKDVFIRKAEVSLNFLNKEAAKLNSLKSEFNKIKKDLGFDLSTVKNELEELEKYEQLKIDLDKQIQLQKKSSFEKIDLMSKELLREKKKFNRILSNIQKEEESLEKEKAEAVSLEESEKFIKNKLKSLKAVIKDVEKKVLKEEEDVLLSNKHIKSLADKAEKIREKIESEKRVIEPMVKDSLEKAKKIKELQGRVTKKIEEKEKKLYKVKRASKKIKNLFKKKLGIMGYIERINKDRNDLQLQLIELIKKAKAFELHKKGVDVGSQITSIENKFKELDSKKKAFEKKLKNLSSAYK